MTTKRWNDSWAADADSRCAAIFATISTSNTPAKRLRISGQILRQIDQFHLIKRSAIAELRDAGWSYRQIGEVLGVSGQSIWQTMHRRHPFPKETREIAS